MKAETSWDLYGSAGNPAKLLVQLQSKAEGLSTSRAHRVSSRLQASRLATQAELMFPVRRQQRGGRLHSHHQVGGVTSYSQKKAQLCVLIRPAAEWEKATHVREVCFIQAYWFVIPDTPRVMFNQKPGIPWLKLAHKSDHRKEEKQNWCTQSDPHPT